jgi:hypothetical protein
VRPGLQIGMLAAALMIDDKGGRVGRRRRRAHTISRRHWKRRKARMRMVRESRRRNR